MHDLWDVMSTFVESQISHSMEDDDFYGFLEINPSLFGVVSSAIRSGDVTTGILDVNFPECIDQKEKEAVHLVTELKELALWLISAGRKFEFNVFGFEPNGDPCKKRKPRKQKKAKRNIKSCDNIPKQQKALRKLCRKVGGTDVVKALIQNAYIQSGSQTKAAKAMSKQHRMKISQNMFSRWMRYFNLKSKPQLGGRRVTLKRSLLKVDTILRKKIGMGLVPYIRQERSKDVIKADIIRKLKTFTRIEISSGSMSALCRRMKIK